MAFALDMVTAPGSSLEQCGDILFQPDGVNRFPVAYDLDIHGRRHAADERRGIGGNPLAKAEGR